MRLEGKAKSGFYPTPPRVFREIKNAFERGNLLLFKPIDILDPCCGDGSLGYYWRPVKFKFYGIELNTTRFRLAEEHFQHVYNGDAFTYTARYFDCLFLNPPYDNVGQNRLEALFLEHFIDALNPFGWLIYIIPEANLEQSRNVLESNYKTIEIIRFPAEEYLAFGQVIVVATPSARIHKNPLPVVENFRPLSPLMVRKDLNPPELNKNSVNIPDHVIKQSPVWKKIWAENNPNPFTPANPICIGHMALLLASGHLENTLVQFEGTTYLIKGSTNTVIEKVYEEGILKEKPTFVGKINAIDMSNGEFVVFE